MKIITGAFIVLLSVTVSLIISFKRISAESTVHTLPLRQQYPRIVRPSKIGEIPMPAGFTRVAVQPGSFGEWLREVYLRKNNIVYLFNGQPIEQQDMHYAILDISTGTKDLQQCADAIMRLKAEYYFARKEYNNISFPGAKNTVYNFNTYSKKQDCYSHDCLLKFMETVFINCGTYTVDEMTKPINITAMQAGDVFVKAGAPGHAMIVVDVAENTAGEKIFMLAQSYMPAQDMHIVINPMNTTLSPWYAVMNFKTIITPGWVFNNNQLKRWK